MTELNIGDIIKERYRLLQFLGNGSFGEVWLALDLLSGQEVALKIYLTLDPAGIEEFQREYANTIDLTSPYLLTPRYFDVHGRRPFLVMKYCSNGSSSKLVGNATEEQIWQFIEDVANGLAVLHNQTDPIVHQDIKPDNILIDSNGRFLITDFGISKRLRATMRRQSNQDVSSGAMPYMAPERFESTPRLTTSSDIWSLGASIYELATGELPFSGLGGTMLKHGADMPSLSSAYSERLNSLMQRCLLLDEKNRPTVSQILELVNSRNCIANNDTTTTNNDPITSYNINNPETEIQLNIRGNITPTVIKPSFNDAFVAIWGYCIIISYVLVRLHFPFFSRYMEEGEVPTLQMILRGIVLLGPIVMWLLGYRLVKQWKSVGKYLMCGAIYPMFLTWLSFLVILIYSIHDSHMPNFEHWYDYLEFIIAWLGATYFSICTIAGFIDALKSIKKGGKIHQSIWLYNGKRSLPIFYEFVLPVIIVILYIISWII